MTKSTRAEAVYEAIRDELLGARIPPATKLKLVEYSQRFDVSLTVVREAMNRLAEQALLQATPQRGFSTPEISVEALRELTRARILLETITLREAITNGDLEWEAAVVSAHHVLAAMPMKHADGSVDREFARRHRDFHIALLAGAGNSYLQSLTSGLRDRAEMYLAWSCYLNEDPLRDIAGEHRELTELTIAREADAATDALSHHIKQTTDSLIEYIAAHRQ